MLKNAFAIGNLYINAVNLIVTNAKIIPIKEKINGIFLTIGFKNSVSI